MDGHTHTHTHTQTHTHTHTHTHTNQGLTLTAAATVVFAELDVTPGLLLQAEVLSVEDCGLGFVVWLRLGFGVEDLRVLKETYSVNRDLSNPNGFESVQRDLQRQKRPRVKSFAHLTGAELLRQRSSVCVCVCLRVCVSACLSVCVGPGASDRADECCQHSLPCGARDSG